MTDANFTKCCTKEMESEWPVYTDINSRRLSRESFDSLATADRSIELLVSGDETVLLGFIGKAL